MYLHSGKQIVPIEKQESYTLDKNKENSSSKILGNTSNMAEMKGKPEGMVMGIKWGRLICVVSAYD